MTEQNTTEQTLQFDVMQIMEMIPHRYPSTRLTGTLRS